MQTTQEHPEAHGLRRIDVAIITTSGAWPQDGFETVPSTQPVRVQLQHAVKGLGITDVEGWIAKVGNRELNVEVDYLDNGLTGQIEIDYGPREGGGGYE
jgi:hypothetical protein